MTPIVRWLASLLVVTVACSDVGEAPDSTQIVGRVLDLDGAPIVEAEVSSVPPTQTVLTDNDGRFRLEGARFTINYVVTARKDGYRDSSTVVTPTAQGPNEVSFALDVQQTCVPGERRCVAGGVQGVETCEANGSGYGTAVLCADGESCDESDATCKTAYDLNVTVSAAGVVLSEPAGINCGASCERSYPAGTQVTLTAVPLSQAAFDGWGDDCASAATSTTCVVSMNDDRTVSADFRAIAFPVAVRTVGTGDGRITSAPAGIDCGPTCTATFDTDSTVTLTATPENGATFETWLRDCASAGSAPTCTLTVDDAKDVRARFVAPQIALTVTTEGMAAGRVTSSPEGIDCGSTCSAGFTAGTEVTLTAAPEDDAGFLSWGGDCASEGSSLECTLTLNQARAAAATFEPFYIFPLDADDDCVVGISFDGASPLDHRCGSGPAAVAVGPGAYTQATSRSEPLDSAYLPADADPAGAINTGRSMPSPPAATLELTVRRDGSALDGSGRAVLFSDVDANWPAGGLRVLALDDGSVAIQTWDDGQPVATTTAANVLPAGQWIHVAVTVSTADGLGLIVDGQPTLEPDGAVTWTASSSTGYVAGERDGVSVPRHRLNGAVDEVRLSGGVRY